MTLKYWYLILSNLLFQMPCWYFGKKELRQTPSFRQGMDSATEARYRREGARFIIDAGTKLGLYPFTVILYFVSNRLNVIFLLTSHLPEVAVIHHYPLKR